MDGKSVDITGVEGEPNAGDRSGRLAAMMPSDVGGGPADSNGNSARRGPAYSNGNSALRESPSSNQATQKSSNGNNVASPQYRALVNEPSPQGSSIPTPLAEMDDGTLIRIQHRRGAS